MDSESLQPFLTVQAYATQKSHWIQWDLPYFKVNVHQIAVYVVFLFLFFRKYFFFLTQFKHFKKREKKK